MDKQTRCVAKDGGYLEKACWALQFSHGLWEADLTVSALDDAMAVRAAIDQCNATHRGEGVAIVRHQYLPGAIKYNILT